MQTAPTTGHRRPSTQTLALFDNNLLYPSA
jgi:hypothetical protein